MSKVLIDNNIIDLEMVTYITTPKDNRFYIYLANTKKPIEIIRYPILDTYGLVKNLEFSVLNIISNPTTELKEKCMEAEKAINKMFKALLERWSPSMIKFENLTVN